MVCRLLFALIVMFSPAAFAIEKASRVVVIKSERTLGLYSGDRLIQQFAVTFGANPKGHKQREGDERTPEGRYILDFKNPNSAFHKSIRVSYPNAEDLDNAQRRNVNPGGAVMIHGQKNGFEWASFIMQHVNWTDGCIALSNKDMDKVWEAVDAGTPIEIKP
jgi:murein L,D-transpeptidase YafK